MYKLVVAFSLIFSPAAFGQFGYFTLGYGGNATNLAGINEVVKNYNDTRPWLDKQMNTFGYLDGLSFAFGGTISHAWTDAEYGFRSQKNSASGQDLYGFNNKRELKIRNGTIALNLGFITSETRLPFAIGFRVEFGRLLAKTRVFGESNAKEKMEQLGYSELTMKFGPVIKVFGMITDRGTLITGSVYYTWSAFTHNVTQMDVELNNSSYIFADGPQFDFKPNTLGFNVNIGVRSSN